METNAPGQLLGFSLQLPPALWLLLSGVLFDQIRLKAIGNVSVAKGELSQPLKGDKSFQNGNPVMDVSADPGKIFCKWINPIIVVVSIQILPSLGRVIYY